MERMHGFARITSLLHTAGLLAVTMLPACSLSRVEPAAKTCLADVQCDPGQICSNGFCTSQPQTDAGLIDAGGGPTSCPEVEAGPALIWASGEDIISGDENGGNLETLLTNARSPRVSPSGVWVASIRTAAGVSSLWLSNRDGSCSRQLTTIGDADATRPAWSADSQFVYFVAGGRCQRTIQRINIQTNATEVVLQDQGEYSDLEGHPEDALLLFRVDDCMVGGSGIFALSVDSLPGSDPQAIVAIEGPDIFAGAPNFTRDGSQFIYEVTRDGGGSFETFVTDTAGMNRRSVTTGRQPVFGFTANTVYLVQSGEIIQYTIRSAQRTALTADATQDTEPTFTQGVTACPAGQQPGAMGCINCNSASACGSDCGPCPADTAQQTYRCTGQQQPSTSSCQATTLQPMITEIEPESVPAGSPLTVVTIRGTNFGNGASVLFNNLAVTVEPGGTASQLAIELPASSLATEGSFPIQVENADGSSSNTITFTVTAGPPSITGLVPAEKVAGEAAFTLQVLGTNFEMNHQIVFGGAALTTTLVSATELSATVPASAITTAGPLSVLVRTPSADSSPLTFTVRSSTPPTLTLLMPDSALAGSSTLTLTATGANFLSGAEIIFDSVALSTSVGGPGQLTAQVPASQLANARTTTVAVRNPGGVLSGTLPFAVNNPAPTISGVSPNSAARGGSDVNITVTGTGFVNGSMVRANTAALATTFTDATSLAAVIPASMLTATGDIDISVINAAPGGGTSGNQTFTVTFPAPVITTLSPSRAFAGGIAFQLTINGTFDAMAQAQFNGVNVTTTFNSITNLTADIPASAITTAGTATVTVVHPGNVVSNAASFIIDPQPNNAVPTLNSINPSSATAGDPTFTLTLNGADFANGATVLFGTSTLTASLVSATQLTAMVPANLILSTGPISVQVRNPAPGGGVSGAQTFTVNAGVMNPVPTLTSISPNMSTAGSSDVTVVVFGTNFCNTGTTGCTGPTVVQFNGVDVTTAFFSPTLLQVTIPASAMTAAGTFNVVAVNPAPGGGSSNALPFTVN